MANSPKQQTSKRTMNLGTKNKEKVMRAPTKASGFLFNKTPKPVYELIHGPSFVVESINVDEKTQMNGSLVQII